MNSGLLDLLRARLDADEMALLVGLHVSHKTAIKTAAGLGWSPWRLDRIRKRLERKTAKLYAAAPRIPHQGPDELPSLSNPVYLERLDSGHRVWSMAYLPDSYRDLAIDSLPFAQVVANKQSVQNAHRVGRDFMSDLERKLQQAEKTFSRVRDESDSADRAVDLLTQQLLEAQKADVTPSVEAILAGKKPITGNAVVDDLEQQLDAAKRAADIYRLAVNEAAVQVETIKGEIAEQQEALDAAALAPEVTAWYAAVDQMTAAHEAISRKLNKLGRNINLQRAIFPLKNIPGADWRARRTWVALQALFNAAANVAALKESGAAAQYDREKEAA